MCYPTYTAIMHSWIYDWQTLIAGGLALVAALATVLVTKWQIRESKANADAALQQTENHEERRWKSKRNAARAVMPLSLTAMVDYTETCAEFLLSILSTQEGQGIPRNNTLVLPQLPIDAIKSLQNVIELTEGRVAKHLANLLAKLQIQHSRMRGSIRSLSATRGDRMVLVANIESHLIDTAIIAAFTSSFFEYARFERNEVAETVPYADVFRALQVMGIHEHQAGRVFETIRRRQNLSATVDLGEIRIEDPRAVQAETV